MAFPAVVNTANTSGLGTSVPLVMPGSIVEDNLLLAVLGTNSAVTDLTGGWILIGSAADGTTGYNYIYGREATGSDSGTVTTGSSSAGVAAHTYQVSGWSGVIADIKMAGVGNTNDPPLLTMEAGAADYLWLAASSGGSALTGAPANYTNLIANSSSFGGYFLGTARRTLNAASENPGTFTGGVVGAQVATTVGIPPGAPSANPSAFLPFFGI